MFRNESKLFFLTFACVGLDKCSSKKYSQRREDYLCKQMAGVDKDDESNEYPLFTSPKKIKKWEA